MLLYHTSNLLIDGTTSPACPFDFIEGGIRILEDITLRIIPVREGYANTEGYRGQIILGVLQKIIGPVDLIDYDLLHGTVGTGHDDSKFIPSDSADIIHRTETMPKYIRNSLQYPVSYSMSICIIDILEMIHVYDDYRGLRFRKHCHIDVGIFPHRAVKNQKSNMEVLRI